MRRLRGTGRCAFAGYCSRALHTITSIHIYAPREQVFQTVSDLARWPELLPHYRSIDFLGQEGTRQIVRMAATRSGIPIAWVSAYEADRNSLELRFEHLRAWTKGMRVVWTLTPTRDGTRVEIVHDLKFRVFGLGWLAEPIIGGFFIGHIANKTLGTFKQILEAEAKVETPQA
jgi:ribosome-associated toxin RatA of RatAB toxin-antitoxin module